MKNNKKGFTLIELLVVIAIIGLLSTLSILALNSARARARDAKRIADVKQIQTALEMYYNDTGDYPTSASTTPGLPISSTNGTYMKAIPAPPTPNDGGCPPANAYTYTYVASATGGTGSASTYGIAYCLGASINGIPADAVQTAGPSGMKQ
jgi:type II secretion system protein G